MIFTHTWENETIFHEAYVTDEKYLDHFIGGFLVYTDKQPQKLNPKWNDEEMGWFMPLE